MGATDGVGAPLFGDALMQKMLIGVEDDPTSPRRLNSDVDLELDRLDAREVSRMLFKDWMSDTPTTISHKHNNNTNNPKHKDQKMMKNKKEMEKMRMEMNLQALTQTMINGVDNGVLKLVQVNDPLREFLSVYTNGIKGEICDLITVLCSLRIRGLYAKLEEYEKDFRKWWEFFSRFAVRGLLFAIEQDVFGFVNNLMINGKKGKNDVVENKEMIEKWKKYKNSVLRCMEDIRDYCSEVDNVFVLFKLKNEDHDHEGCVKLIPFLYKKAEKLTEPLLELLQTLDNGLDRFVRGHQVPARSLMQMHRAAVKSVQVESGLGLAALSALTGWMPSREMRRDFTGLHVRGVKKLGFMKAAKSVNDKHYAIVDGFRERAIQFRQ